jgi:hypothetical protein
MGAPAFEQNFLDHVEERIRWHKRSANRTMVQFIAVRLGLVVASAALPALTLLSNNLWAILTSVLVASLTGLDTQFQWGEEWRHFRSTQLAIERAQRDFQKRKYAICAGATAQSEADNFDAFYAEVEALLQTETERFFKFRIAPWKAASSKAE